MGNVTTTDITNLVGSSSVNTINQNTHKLRDEFDKVIYKDGREEMTGDLDLNGHRILNLPAAVNPSEPVILSQLDGYTGGGGGGGGTDLTAVYAAISLKSDLTYVNTQLGTKASTTALTTGLATKADATATTTALATKADATATTAALATKLTDAPSDGQLRGRKDGAWTIVPTSSGTGDASVLNTVSRPAVADTSNNAVINKNFTTIATQVIADITTRWWDGSKIWGGEGGYTYSNTRPALWFAENIHNCLFWYWKKTANSAALTKINSQYTYVTSTYSNARLQSAVPQTGSGVGTAGGPDVGASDDVAWNLMYLCQVHEATGNAQALTNAAALISSVRSTFADPNSSGAGILYTRDAESGTLGHYRRASIYEAVIALSAFYVYKQNGDGSLLTYAISVYNWIKTYLKDSTTGVYYTELDINPASPTYKQVAGIGEPDYYKTSRGYSLKYVAGTAAMGALAGRLYTETGTAGYLTELNSIVTGMLRYDTFLRSGDIFVTDRDGWTSGTMFPYLVQYGLSVSGVTDREKAKQCVANTAAAIADQRTEATYIQFGVQYGEGFYGADWSGPEAGGGNTSTWIEQSTFYNGARPTEMQTMGNSLSVVIAGLMTDKTSITVKYATATQMQKMGLDIVNSIRSSAYSYQPVFTQDLYVAAGKGYKVDATGYLQLSGTNFNLNSDNNDVLRFDRVADKWQFYIGNSNKMEVALTAVNFNVSSYMVPGEKYRTDAQCWFGLNSGATAMTLQADTGGDELNFYRPANYWDFRTSGNSRLTIGDSDVTASVPLAGTRVEATNSGGNNYIGQIGGLPAIGMGSGNYINCGTAMSFVLNGTNIYQIVPAGQQPAADNTYVSGTPTNRWNGVFTLGVYTTSDAREKTARRDLTTTEKAAYLAAGRKIGIFQFLDAIDKKGADHARLHTGVLAQEAGQCFTDRGLDPTRYGFFCYDEWEAKDGKPAGNRYGISYDELAMGILAALIPEA